MFWLAYSRMTHKTHLISMALAILGCVSLAPAPLHGQTPAGTAFSYQGRLLDAGAPATGTYDLQFTLFDAATAGSPVAAPVVRDDVMVAGGLFTVTLDFGAAFAGQARWIEIGVRPGVDAGAFTPLGARQEITPAPHALFSASTPWSGLTGVPAGFADGIDSDSLGALACAAGQVPKRSGAAWTCATADTLSALAPSCGVTQVPRWNGTAWSCAADTDTLTTLACAPGQLAKWNGTAWACAADTDASGTSWHLGGNAGTTAASFLGTTDNTPLELRVNGRRALRIVPAANPTEDAPVLIGGSYNNSVTGVGGTVAGGGSLTLANGVFGDYGFVGGGHGNSAGAFGVVSGGTSNTALDHGAVAGGAENFAGGGAVVGGGFQNSAPGATSVILGGTNNLATGQFAVVAGGNQNVAAGRGSFAAGYRASAVHDSSFVWADSTDHPVLSSTAAGQFIVGATGGVWFGNASSGIPNPMPGFIATSIGAYLSNSGIWTNVSDRNLKENFEPVDGRALLDRLARLPVTEWNYKKDPYVRHIGPTAQDFQAVFGFGGDDKTISTLDPSGIALRAIQQLDRENRELQQINQSLRETIDALRRTIDEHAAQLATLEAASTKLQGEPSGPRQDPAPAYSRRLEP